MKKHKHSIRNWMPGIFILIVCLTFFAPVLFQNKIPMPADAIVGAHIPWTELKWDEYPVGVPIKNLEISDSFSHFYPWKTLAADFWRSGEVPLWNPYMFSGTPFLATLHSAVLYPFNIFFVLFGDIYGWTALVFSQILLGAYFMYFFLRKLNLNRYASVFGAISFTFSGYQIAWLEFTTGGHAGIWLPLLLLFEINLVEKGKRWLVPIAIAFFFLFTAGDFQVPLYTVLIYVLFAVSLTKGINRKVILPFVGLLVGVTISLPQLLPTIELFGNSIRIDDPYISAYNYGLLDWERIITYFWPDFYGNVVTRNLWARFTYHEYLLYQGIIVIPFIVYGLVTRKLKHEKFFVVLFVVSVLFLLPTSLGLLPYKLHIPGLSTSSASRVIYVLNFSGSIMAAHGLHKFIYKSNKHKLFWILIILTLSTFTLGTTVFGARRYMFGNLPELLPEMVVNLQIGLRNMIPGTTLVVSLFIGFVIIYYLAPKISRFGSYFSSYSPTLFGIFVILLLCADLLYSAGKNTSFSKREFVFPEVELLTYLKKNSDQYRIGGMIPLNLHMPYKLYSHEGYDPMFPKTNALWLSAVNHGSFDYPSRRYGIAHTYSRPLTNISAVRYVVDYKKDIHGNPSDNGDYLPGIESDQYEEVFKQGRVSVFENKSAWPYAWMTSKYEIVSDDEIVQRLLVAEKESIFLEETPSGEYDNDKSLEYEITELSKGNNSISMKVDTNQPALLFVSETYYPGWEAFVNDDRQTPMKANYLYQAIEIPAGESDVRMIYRPKSFSLGVYAAVATLIILIIYEFDIPKMIAPRRK